VIGAGSVLSVGTPAQSGRFEGPLLTEHYSILKSQDTLKSVPGVHIAFCICNRRRLSRKRFGMALWLRGRLAVLFLFSAFAEARAEDVTLTARDGVKVYGQFAAADGAESPVILLFHMAGSNRAEYAPIIPRLNKAGFSVLAIDQRSGGSGFGARNRTVDALRQSGSYEAAVMDLEAALAWAKQKANGAPILAWGSSYSAALVFLIAAENPADVAGVLAFSPGEYLTGHHEVGAAAARVNVPVFITQARDRREIEQARQIFSILPGQKKTQFLPPLAGVHGSSSLRDDANPTGAKDYWAALMTFLAQFKTP
jgi:dienelactone hydrolase